MTEPTPSAEPPTSSPLMAGMTESLDAQDELLAQYQTVLDVVSPPPDDESSSDDQSPDS